MVKRERLHLDLSLFWADHPDLEWAWKTFCYYRPLLVFMGLIFVAHKYYTTPDDPVEDVPESSSQSANPVEPKKEK